MLDQIFSVLNTFPFPWYE